MFMAIYQKKKKVVCTVFKAQFVLTEIIFEKYLSLFQVIGLTYKYSQIENNLF